MRKLTLLFLVALFGLMILPNSISAKQYDNLITLPLDEAQLQELEAIEAEGEVLGMETTKMVEDMSETGPHFYFGEDVLLEDNLIGDVYVAGGNVEILGIIDGDLLVAGGTVILNGEVTQDVRAIGGSLMVNGIIGENLTIIGGNIIFSSTSSVGNSLVAGGGEVSIDGEVLGNVFLGGGSAKLAGEYGANVNASADTIKIAPGVIIAGSLIAEAELDAQVSEQAVIDGDKMVTISLKSDKVAATDKKMKSVGGVLVKATLVEFFVKLSMALVSGSVIIYFLPKLVKQVSNRVLEAPLANAGWGLVYLFFAPILIVLTMISVVGLPLAGILTLIYLLTMFVAKWAVAYAVGAKLGKNLKIKVLENKYLGFAIGLLVINAVGFVPVLGWLVKVIAYLIGMGAVYSLIKTKILTKKKK